MDLGELFFQFILNLLVTVVVYLLVPTIVVNIRQKMPKSKIKKIAMANATVCFLVFVVIGSEAGSETINAAPAVLWGSVGYWLMKKFCEEEPEDEAE